MKNVLIALAALLTLAAPIAPVAAAAQDASGPYVVASSDYPYHWYLVRGSKGGNPVYTFDPEVPGDQDRAYRTASAHAARDGARVAGPFRGTALPAM